VPTYQLKKVKEIRDAENLLRRSLGRKPDREEISERLERSLTKIDQVLQFTLREMSLDDKVGKDRTTPISDYLVDESCASPEDDLIKRESNSLVSEAMAHLTEQEKVVIYHRFGISGGPSLTLKEIGEMMSVSRERVRQIECQAKNRLRKIFARKRLMKAPPKRPFPVGRMNKRFRIEH
jgi:RNA polymerase sigma factor (sigma-70 family)